MFFDPIFQEAFSEPTIGLTYQVGKRLRALCPEKALIEGNDCDFTLHEYVNANLCTLDPAEGIHARMEVMYLDGKIHTMPRTGWFEVSWRGHSIDVVLIATDCGDRHFWILADTPEIAEEFFKAVCAHVPRVEAESEVLVYDGGYWLTSESLHQSIRDSTRENLVLAEELKTSLFDDFDRFFDSKELYESYGIPWKRGILLTGPPGNGKTHAVKALINGSKKPCLYVKSFASEDRDVVENSNMRRVFHRARRVAPCVLVLEDLDSLINDDNRSFFLNEMDGFAANRGVVVIATTNHPEKLDPAIINRPSRFDRRYHFHDPAEAERRAYLAHWNTTWNEPLRLSEAGLTEVAARTEGFSFAYLKELALTSTMAWINSENPGPMDAVIGDQVDLLRSQMKGTAVLDLESLAGTDVMPR